MNRLMEKMVFSGLVIACRLATWPTSRSPLFENPTTEGVVRAPSSFGITLGSPPSITATHGVGGSEINTDNLCHVLGSYKRENAVAL